VLHIYIYIYIYIYDISRLRVKSVAAKILFRCRKPIIIAKRRFSYVIGSKGKLRSSGLLRSE